MVTRRPRILLLACVLLSSASSAQVISTIAGGGYNNIPATSAGLGSLSQLAIDNSGNIFVPSGNQLFEVAPSRKILLFAGNGARSSQFSGEGGPAVNATFSLIQSVAVDGSGNVYVGDTSLCNIWKIDASTRKITTLLQSGNQHFCPVSMSADRNGDLFVAAQDGSFNSLNAIYEIPAGSSNQQAFAGNGTAGFNGDLGPATSAELNSPQGVFVDQLGNVFIADSENNRIREVQASTGDIVTVAGNGTAGFSGDGGAPTLAALNRPIGLVVDRNGDIYISDQLNARVRSISASSGLIQTVVGTGTLGFSGDGGPATAAQIYPWDVVTDSNGNLYLADDQNRIREVSATTQIITTIAGTGSILNGDGFPATSISLDPTGLVAEPSGDLIFVHPSADAIRKISATAGITQTLAGNGKAGYTGDGGPATSAELSGPTDITLDNQQDIFIADDGNQVLREVSASDGIINTVSPIPVSCNLHEFCSPTYLANTPTGSVLNSVQGGIFVDSNGNVFQASHTSNYVTETFAATNQTITIAGIFGQTGYSGDGGLATNATLSSPTFITEDAAGNLFIADSGNNVVREVTVKNGIIQTIAGNGEGAFCGDGGPAYQACLQNPQGLAFNVQGELLIADEGNGRIRKISGTIGVPLASLSPSSLTFSPAVLVGSSATQNVTLSNVGALDLAISGISIANGNSIDYKQSNNCSTVSPSGACTISVTFTPTAGGARASELVVSSNSQASLQPVQLNGIGSDFSMSSNGPSSQTVSPGQGATFTLNFVSIGGFDQIVQLSCSGAPAQSTCSVTNQISLSSSASATVTITTTAPTIADARFSRSILALCTLFPLLLISCRQPRRQKCNLGIVFVILTIVSICGCGGNSMNQRKVGGSGTPTGSYTLTISGTFQSNGQPVTHSIPLGLTVQ